jgi:thermitase
MARRGTGWGILFLGLVVAALAGCSLFETAMGPGEDSIVGEPGLVAGLEDGDLWVAQDAYASVEALPRQGTAQIPEFVPGQLIVKLRVGQYSDANVKSLATKYVVKTSGKNKSLRLALVTVPAGTSLDEMKAKLAADPKVESVGLNQVYRFADVGEEPLRPEAITNDEYFYWQWALWQIGYNKVPKSALPTTGVTIAVVDSGVDYTHLDIGTAKVIKGPDYYDGDMDPKDVYGHGTHVTGIAAALTGNNKGVAGVSGPSKILAIRVGNYWIPTFAAAAGITYAADNSSVKVINCSWGGYGTDPYIADAVNYATAVKGKLLVAAAGNGDSDLDHYPSAYPNVLSVGATYYDDVGSDVKSSFSNYGVQVDIAAPGEDILSTVPLGFDFDWPYWYMSGTSMASPLVAGAAAVVWAKWPTMTAAQVQALLVTTAVTGILPAQTAPFNEFEPDVGRLDLYEAFLSKIPTLPAATGAIWGVVCDAAAKNSPLQVSTLEVGLAGATVKATKVGAPTIYRTATTRADGMYTIVDLPAGDYNLTVSKLGYATTPGIAPVTVWDGEMTWSTWRSCFAIPKAQAAGTYSVVLQWRDWANAESELDSFLWLPESLDNRKKFALNYLDRGILNIHPYGRFLMDSRSGDDFGSPVVAECIVFKGTYAGTYRFAVWNSDEVYEETDWSYANAIVRLYNGATFKQAFWPQVTTPSAEDWWPVFELTWPGGAVAAGFPLLGYGAPPTEYPGPYSIPDFDLWTGAPAKIEPAVTGGVPAGPGSPEK